MGRIDKKLGIALGIVAVVIAVFVIVNVHSPNKLTLWYTNDKITAFLNKVATEYEASTGVDIISSSAIVAKAPTLDLGLDM